MPDEETWSSFFSPEQVLAKLSLTKVFHHAVDFGCGYGTFAIPTARVVQGIVHAFDIEAEMVEITTRKATAAGLTNVQSQKRDFITAGTGLPDASIDYVMLFNILHCEQPDLLIREAWRILGHNGLLAIMHWNFDPSTPRGPSMDIRPQPEQCLQWSKRVGFGLLGPAWIDLPPHHYGIVLHK